MRTLRLRERKIDLLFLAFFVVNLGFITYIFDLEQLVIADPSHFEYPIWPPPPLVDLVHWYGTHYDPLLLARPPFWRMTIWIDVIYFGPFYAFAIYAFVRGRSWIRMPALVWSGLMLANVLILLMEERYGVTPAPNFPLVLALNLAWLLMPFAMMLRMRREHPFGRPSTPEPSPGGSLPAQSSADPGAANAQEANTEAANAQGANAQGANAQAAA
jgi:EXPERA (EXPanded EBP superfamily)